MNKKKSINIEVLDSILQDGIIRIAPFEGTMLIATFFPNDKSNPVSERSDRGIKHLFNTLRGKILMARKTKEDYAYGKATIESANQAYPYPRSVSCPSTLMRMLQRSLTTLSRKEDSFIVKFEQYNVPSLNATAGWYLKIGEGRTIEKAFGYAIVASPVSFTL